MHLIEGLKKSHDISEPNVSFQSNSAMGSSFVLLKLDSFAELHAGNDEAELQPKSPMTIHAIHGSIYDYVKESENREIACIVGK